MKKTTRFKFNAYLQQVAKLNGITDVGDVGKKFSVEPSVTQSLMNVVQESSEFLTRINMTPVAELKGEKVGVGVNGSIASTTDTDGGKERQTADFTSLESNKYECQQVNFDFHMRYNQLDLWARYQDFQLRIRNAIAKRQALDFIMAGFNGISRAATSDRTKNPMLQDVAVGWLQKYRNEAPARVMSNITGEDGAVISPVIRIGKGGDYANLDAVVMDATNNLIAPWHQESPDLVVICGRKLLADKYFPLVNQEQPNTEAMAADVIVSQKRIGNLPAVRVPFFPANAIMVTTLENLSIYIMDESHRRHIEENAKRDRVENYESMKIDYVIEDYAAGCLIENIELLPASTEKSGVRVSKEDPQPSGADISALADAIVLAVKGAAAQPAAAGEETPKTEGEA
ncbi:TPA: phage major capsid protein, P2 family [Serratia marcescens]|uniref:phage major capsid protein, P2 family n=1 Tax=Serratia marcescens TaxID=615 RepID=UPI000E3E061D|nr:phage major capsid protein, P2 family [Serratia marcescens]MBH2690119.1 phage major capsid protein, P2 family [Serratia marcescens]MBH2737812.1 phage major capsid protein, P2 family [Serratia marcescens]MBH2829553.1 phage major capsid protein, P2 family [Serratia marcescens]MBH3223454.1 phage major capsid protein, P2 family [Serratia marcescens]QVV71869.1 phage major capsid protein, P2 family [Serratia marcescens]